MVSAPSEGCDSKREETPPGKVQATPPATNPVQSAATLHVKRGKRGSRDCIERRKQPVRRPTQFTMWKATLMQSIKARLNELRRRRRPIHAVQRYRVNWGEPVTPTESVKPWDANNERRQAGALQAVGWPDSTDEGVKTKSISTGGKPRVG